MTLEEVEDAIEWVYREAHKAYVEGRVRELPRLNPNVGYLGELWSLFDVLVAGDNLA